MIKWGNPVTIDQAARRSVPNVSKCMFLQGPWLLARQALRYPWRMAKRVFIVEDEAAIRENLADALKRHGYPIEDAREYGIVGCVEPSIPGKSFLSTDASLFNLPICIELALNSGRRLGRRRRIGARTENADSFKRMEEVMAAFKKQVEHMVSRLIKDIQYQDFSSL